MKRWSLNTRRALLSRHLLARNWGKSQNISVKNEAWSSMHCNRWWTWTADNETRNSRMNLRGKVFGETENYLPLSGFEPCSVQPEAYSLHRLRFSLQHNMWCQNVSLFTPRFVEMLWMQDDFETSSSSTLNLRTHQKADRITFVQIWILAKPWSFVQYITFFLNFSSYKRRGVKKKKELMLSHVDGGKVFIQ